MLANPRVELRIVDERNPTDPPRLGGSFLWFGGNPQSENWLSPADHPSSTKALEQISLCWSGTFADELFAGDVRNWTRTGHAALGSWLDRTLPGFSAKGPLGIVPHHTHLLSDVAGQMRLWSARSEQGLATVLYPSGLIAPSMVGDIEDHLVRSISMLGPRCSLCILEDIAPIAGEIDSPTHFNRVPWGTGIIPRELVDQLLLEHLPSTTPLFIASNPPFFR